MVSYDYITSTVGKKLSVVALTGAYVNSYPTSICGRQRVGKQLLLLLLGALLSVCYKENSVWYKAVRKQEHFCTIYYIHTKPVMGFLYEIFIHDVPQGVWVQISTFSNVTPSVAVHYFNTISYSLLTVCFLDILVKMY